MFPFQFLNEIAADTTATAGFHDMMSAMSGMSPDEIKEAIELLNKNTSSISETFNTIEASSSNINSAIVEILNGCEVTTLNIEEQSIRMVLSMLRSRTVLR